MTLLLLVVALPALGVTHHDFGWIIPLLLLWGCAAFFGAFWAVLTIVVSLRDKDTPALHWGIILLILCVVPVCLSAVHETWGHLLTDG